MAVKLNFDEYFTKLTQSSGSNSQTRNITQMKRKQKNYKNYKFVDQFTKKNFLELTNHLLLNNMLDKRAYVCMKAFVKVFGFRKCYV